MSFQFEAQPGPRSLSKVFLTFVIANILVGIAIGVAYAATALLVTTGTVGAGNGILCFVVLLTIPLVIVAFGTFTRIRSLTKNGYAVDFSLGETFEIRRRTTTVFQCDIADVDSRPVTIAPTSGNQLDQESVGLKFAGNEFPVTLVCAKTDFRWTAVPAVSEDIIWLCSPSDFLRLVGELGLESLGDS